MTHATPEIERLVNDYEDLWNGDYSKREAVAESVVVADPLAGEVRGRDALEAFVREFRTAFPDLRITTDELLASEDDLVMIEWTATGTHEGAFEDIPPTEREIDITGMSTVVIADGEVQEDRIYYDRQELFEQLGLADD